MHCGNSNVHSMMHNLRHATTTYKTQSLISVLKSPNMKTLTKAQVVSEFRSLWQDSVSYDPALRGDHVAKREAFNNFVDLLNKQRQVSDHQAFTWTNPF